MMRAAAVLLAGLTRCGEMGWTMSTRKEAYVVETLPAKIWLDRCTRRIAEVEQDIAEGDARRIARELHKFERTRAMEPEAAVDFVATELAKPERGRFERRLTSRA
jgi:hypothetical protein